MVDSNADEQAVFIDFDGHKDDEVINNLIKEISLISKGIRIIGSYALF